jgi:hypothetical protein
MNGGHCDARPGRQRSTKRQPFAAQICSDGPTLDAPDCIADDLRKIDADAKRWLGTSFN